LRIKALVISIICFFLCVSALWITAFLAENERHLLIVLPKNISSPKLNVREIDDFIKNNFLITYEILYSEKIGRAYSQFPVTLAGTTSSYPQIMKCIMIEGSFFTNAAWTGKLRQAVLNEKAAFTLFGSNSVTGNRFKTRNDTWLVTGVIRDNYDDSRIYIPSSVWGGEAGAFAMTISGNFDETYVKNSLKNIKITEGDFGFINFNAYFTRLQERIIVTILIFAFFILLTVFEYMLTKLKNALKTIKSELAAFYPAEILKKERIFIIKNMVPVLSVSLIPVFILIILITVTGICLTWKDVEKLNISAFNYQINRIYTLDLVSLIFFIFSIFLICLIFICVRKLKPLS